jgi:hypothetical protein
MSELRDVNVQQCLDTLKDFHNAASVDGNEVFMQKKEQAGMALDQLSSMMSAGSGADTSMADCKRRATNC